MSQSDTHINESKGKGSTTKSILRKCLAVLTYLFHACIAVSIPAGIAYLLFGDNPKVKLTVVAIIGAVTVLFFFIEDIRFSGGLKKHFKHLSK